MRQEKKVLTIHFKNNYNSCNTNDVIEDIIFQIELENNNS